MHVRPARVTAQPTSGGKTFRIIFLDGDYYRMDNSAGAAWFDRQATSSEWCQNIHENGAIPPNGSRIEVFFANDRWWTWWVAPTGTTSDVAIVKITDATATGCTLVNGNASCVWPGKVQSNSLNANQCLAPWIDGSDVWVKPVNACPLPTQLKVGERYVARKAGSLTVSGDTRDLYEIQVGAEGQDNAAVVRFYLSPGQDDGEQLPAISNGFFDGLLQSPDLAVNNANGGAWSDGSPCFLVPVNWVPSVATLPHGERYIGHYAGTRTISGYGTRPVYHVEARPLNANWHYGVVGFGYTEIELVNTVEELVPFAWSTPQVDTGNDVFTLLGTGEIECNAAGLFRVLWGIGCSLDVTTTAGSISAQTGMPIVFRLYKNSTVVEAITLEWKHQTATSDFSGWFQHASRASVVQVADGDQLTCKVTAQLSVGGLTTIGILKIFNVSMRPLWFEKIG